MNCQLCESSQNQLFSNLNDLEYDCGESFNFSKCTKCSFIWLDPTPSQVSLNSFYPSNYHGFNTNSNFLISKLYSIVYYFRFIKYSKYLKSKNPSLLDVGCADARYFKNLSRKIKNLTCHGVEINAEIVNKAKKDGLSIFLGTIDDVPSNLSFDLIIMNNLIEHVIDRLQELKAASRLLKPGGKIFLETPNTDSWDFKIIWTRRPYFTRAFVLFLIKPKARHTLPFVPFLSLLVLKVIPTNFINSINILVLFCISILLSKIYYPIQLATFSGNPQDFPAQHYFMFFGFSCNYNMYIFQIIISILILLFLGKIISRNEFSILKN